MRETLHRSSLLFSWLSFQDTFFYAYSRIGLEYQRNNLLSVLCMYCLMPEETRRAGFWTWAYTFPLQSCRKYPSSFQKNREKIFNSTMVILLKGHIEDSFIFTIVTRTCKYLASLIPEETIVICSNICTVDNRDLIQHSESQATCKT